MIESIIPMTAGLLLDICGAFLIVKLFLDNPKTPPWYDVFTVHGTVLRLPDIKQNDADGEKKRQEKGISNAKFGFAFLICGFFLILIAGWINYFNIQ